MPACPQCQQSLTDPIPSECPRCGVVLHRPEPVPLPEPVATEPPPFPEPVIAESAGTQEEVAEPALDADPATVRKPVRLRDTGQRPEPRIPAAYGGAQQPVSIHASVERDPYVAPQQSSSSTNRRAYQGDPQLRNGKAVPALVCGLLSIVAVILGHQGLRACKENPEMEGSGMCLAGVILGYVSLGLMVFGLLFYLVVFVFYGRREQLELSFSDDPASLRTN